MNISVGSEESVPDGNFKIWYKRTRVWSQSQEQWLPYWMAFKGNKFGIHENVYGVRGSVELSKEDAEYLYNWAPIGTKVRIK